MNNHKCIICGKHVCRGSSIYYKEPLSNMCKDCRKKELDKIMKEE